MQNKEKRTQPMSFKTFLSVKKKLQKLAKDGSRSMSMEMERLIKEAPVKNNS